MQDFLQQIQQNPYIIPAVIIAASLVVGYFFQLIVVKQVRKMSKGTKWKGDDVIIEALGQAPILWFLLGGVYVTLLDFPLAEHREFLWQLILVVLIFSVASISSQIAVGFIHLYADKQKNVLGSTSMFNILVKLTIFVVAILVILQTLGISITPLLTALGVGGLAVALALQETLSNLFAGLHIIAAGKLKPDDYIELDSGEVGFVQDISWRNTTLRTLANNLVIVPNSKIASANITNYAGPQNEMGVLVPVGVSYGSDLKKVEKVITDVARDVLKNVEGAVSDFEPFIRYGEFGDSSINLNVILRAQNFVSQYLLKHEFIKALHERFEKEGIEIPFPQRDVHIKEKHEN